MRRTWLAVVVGAVLGIALASDPASATLTLRSGFQNSALSVDGFGGTTGFLQVDTPAGATVVKAFLYVSDVWGSGVAGDVTLATTFLPVASGTLLTPSPSDGANTRVFDVTSIVKPIVEASGGIKNISIVEGGFSDGDVLVVVYTHASTAGSTAIILDGELALAGDTTVLNFASPYAGGNVIMSLASSFSCCGGSSGINPTPVGQVTVVDVVTSSQASRRLTQCAGGNDDGGNVGGNGQLMTVGGVGDSIANPHPNCTGGGGDDELYNLAAGNVLNANPFLVAGDTSITFNTNNPSHDDNVFGLFFTTAFSVSNVDDTPIPDVCPNPPCAQPPSVPEPASLVLLGVGLVGAAAWRRWYSR